MVDAAWKSRQQGKWLRLLRRGDHQAFAEFIDKYKQTVFLCCRRLGLREEEVEDVAAETFMAAYEGLGRYSGRSELSTWLWSIAYRQGISYLRKNRRLTRLDDEIEQQIPDGRASEPLAAALDGETEQLVWKAVERLPRLWAMAVILYYREEKSVADIAKIMQTNENTVKTWLHRAREKLREVLTGALGKEGDA
ncbi:MAG: RNA polymerase sigma factor [Phycisphaerales bacterium]|nr:MAG: RNA polymerase sigma factor [Phycisphaerales bacterium]